MKKEVIICKYNDSTVKDNRQIAEASIENITIINKNYANLVIGKAKILIEDYTKIRGDFKRRAFIESLNLFEGTGYAEDYSLKNRILDSQVNGVNEVLKLRKNILNKVNK